MSDDYDIVAPDGWFQQEYLNSDAQIILCGGAAGSLI